MNLILHIYFAINLFSAGWVFAENSDAKPFVKYSCTFLAILFGTVIFLSILAWGLLIQKALHFLNVQFQLRFWFDYYFTGRYKNVDLDRLETLNKALQAKGQSKIADRTFRKAVSMINQLNNYKPA